MCGATRRSDCSCLASHCLPIIEKQWFPKWYSTNASVTFNCLQHVLKASHSWCSRSQRLAIAARRSVIKMWTPLRSTVKRTGMMRYATWSILSWIASISSLSTTTSTQIARNGLSFCCPLQGMICFRESFEFCQGQWYQYSRLHDQHFLARASVSWAKMEFRILNWPRRFLL